MGCDYFDTVVRQLAFISTHAPAWGATVPAQTAICAEWRFQLTHPRGVRHLTAELVKIYEDFNSRTRVGCDAPLFLVLPAMTQFQLTHPRGVRPWLKLRPLYNRNFNSRTRVGCDKSKLEDLEQKSDISTHAPAWGATPQFFINAIFTFISTHAPAWGATFVKSRCRRLLKFQLTHPRGVRRSYRAGLNDLINFNSRTRVGCDRTRRHSDCRSNNFNSRTRVGCDATIFYQCHIHFHFNSRTRVGCDFGRVGECQRPLNFNSRTRVGCDKAAKGLPLPCKNFNSRTRVGCDNDNRQKHNENNYFNSRTRVGCDIIDFG